MQPIHIINSTPHCEPIISNAEEFVEEDSLWNKIFLESPLNKHSSPQTWVCENLNSFSSETH